MPRVVEDEDGGGDAESRAIKVIEFFHKATQNSSRMTVQGVDMLLKLAEDDVVNATKGKEQLQSLRSKVEFFQKHERMVKGYGTLLNDLPGAELTGEHENKSKEYVNEFMSALLLDNPTEQHTSQLAKMDKMIQVVSNCQAAGKIKYNIECPISGQTMDDPIRNANCGHVYDRKSIENYFQTRRQSKQAVTCPVEGCESNEQLTWEFLVPDPAVRRAVDEAYFHSVMADNGKDDDD